jgi:hypothetical protein
MLQEGGKAYKINFSLGGELLLAYLSRYSNALSKRSHSCSVGVSLFAVFRNSEDTPQCTCGFGFLFFRIYGELATSEVGEHIMTSLHVFENTRLPLHDLQGHLPSYYLGFFGPPGVAAIESPIPWVDRVATFPSSLTSIAPSGLHGLPTIRNALQYRLAQIRDKSGYVGVRHLGR